MEARLVVGGMRKAPSQATEPITVAWLFLVKKIATLDKCLPVS